MSEMGDRAAGMALRLLDGEQEVEDILVPVELVEWKSCAPRLERRLHGTRPELVGYENNIT